MDTAATGSRSEKSPDSIRDSAQAAARRLRIATVNVNGIRAAQRRGMPDWLASCSPDVLCLQEVRGSDEHLLAALGPGWHQVHEPGSVAGRAGVAVLSRTQPNAVRVGLDVAPEVDGAGRWVELEFSPFVGGPVITAISTYVHTGLANTPRQEEKYAFLDAIRSRIAALRATGTEIVLTGDLNIAHREADLRNWRGNLGKSGFLPRERAWMDDLLADGLIDAVRHEHGDVQGPYSWWSWRGKAFDNDTGWRIDYALISPALAPALRSAQIERAASYQQRWSDHAPVVLDLEF